MYESKISSNRTPVVNAACGYCDGSCGGCGYFNCNSGCVSEAGNCTRCDGICTGQLGNAAEQPKSY